MKFSEHPFLRPYAGKSAVLDSNLLLFYWSMWFDPKLIRTFKRLSGFAEMDFVLLCETLKAFRPMQTTPHVLTEVSNLMNALHGSRKAVWANYFSRQIQLIDEHPLSSATVASVTGPFMRFGLTDAGLAYLAEKCVILTIDFPLSNWLERRGLHVVNFNHLRSIWDA